jgi:hypothetical protein
MYLCGILNNEDMIITKGTYAKKEHLFNGAKTACNIRISGGACSMAEFQYWVDNAPDLCCQKCLNRFIERQSRIKK